MHPFIPVCTRIEISPSVLDRYQSKMTSIHFEQRDPYNICAKAPWTAHIAQDLDRPACTFWRLIRGLHVGSLFANKSAHAQDL
jgi:hypothetical protein